MVRSSLFALLLFFREATLVLAKEEEAVPPKPTEMPKPLDEQDLPGIVTGKDDPIFQAVEDMQGDKPWGDVLDAGTGLHSMRWVGGLEATSIKAVTAATDMQHVVEQEIERLGISGVELVLGNWFGPTPLKYSDEQFDTILVDYLIGAMDAFSPYMQGAMIRKLLKFLKPGGRLYVIGLQPLPTNAYGDAHLLSRMKRARDAALLLAGERPYREYPVKWLESKVNDLPNLQVLDSLKFPLYYTHDMIVEQLNVGRRVFPGIERVDPELLPGIVKHFDGLEAESLRLTENAETTIELGYDYVVGLEKMQVSETCLDPQGCGNTTTTATASMSSEL